jgi:trehalose synthase
VIEHISVEPMDPHRFESVLTDEHREAMLKLIERSEEALSGRVIWNVNSTARGGGVVELLGPLLGYSRGVGLDARWVVISGEPDFFAITKRIHNHLHGFEGDGGSLGDAEREVYEKTLRANADELVSEIGEQDVVILHDPQTAALVEPIQSTGATVIWRCHVGLDRPNDHARAAWAFLRPYIEAADAYVFSREAFAWEGLEQDRIAVIQPSIDVFSPKNTDQKREETLAILGHAGIASYDGDAEPTFARADGTQARVEHRAEMTEVQPLGPEDRVVTQISRWDRLKDPLGVLRGFVDHVADEHPDAHLVLAGPSTEAVSDDPEGAEVFASIREAWEELPDEVKRRIHLASLPMDDVAENAAMVNALQRHSDVVVQKSLAEGFGLTVAEAMWKERPVVASRIGGIQDQIEDGASGRLVSDPEDLREFGSAVCELLGDSDRAEEMGREAHSRVQHHFLGPHHLGRYFDLIERLISARPEGSPLGSAD